MAAQTGGFGAADQGRSMAFAEDIVQEAAWRAFAHAAQLETMSEPKCVLWRYKTAKYIFLDSVRRMKHAPESQTEPPLW